jgi:hypothetical protein
MMKWFFVAATVLAGAAMSTELAQAATLPEYYTVTVEFASKAGDKQKADFKCHRGKTCRDVMMLSLDGKMEEVAFVSKAVDDEALEIRLESHVMGAAAKIDTVGAIEPYEPGKSWQKNVVRTTRIATPQKWEKQVLEKGTVRFTLR